MACCECGDMSDLSYYVLMKLRRFYAIITRLLMQRRATLWKIIKVNYVPVHWVLLQV